MDEILDIQCPRCGELFMGYPNYIKHLKDKTPCRILYTNKDRKYLFDNLGDELKFECFHKVIAQNINNDNVIDYVKDISEKLAKVMDENKRLCVELDQMRKVINECNFSRKKEVNYHVNIGNKNSMNEITKNPILLEDEVHKIYNINF